MPELGILALAMMIPLMSGGLNLAIIATANLSALVMAAILTKMLGAESPAHVTAGVIALALASGLLTSLVVGLITGLIVAFLGVHPILVTLGTMTAVKGRGCARDQRRSHRRLSAGHLISREWHSPWNSRRDDHLSRLRCHRCDHYESRPFGVSVRMIGSNERATRYSGVATEWMLVGVYVVSSALCWVAAAVMMARFNSARAGYAESYLLITILAAVLGGVDPNGGFGKVLGLVLSLVLLQVISTGFNLLGLSPHLTQAIWGATMILAIALALVRERWMARLWLKRT